MQEIPLPLNIPRHIAACPICGADIQIESVDEWETSGKATMITFDCVTQPELGSDEWRGWHATHWSSPYIDWIPIEPLVLSWCQTFFRASDGKLWTLN